MGLRTRLSRGRRLCGSSTCPTAQTSRASPTRSSQTISSPSASACSSPSLSFSGTGSSFSLASLPLTPPILSASATSPSDHPMNRCTMAATPLHHPTIAATPLHHLTQAIPLHHPNTWVATLAGSLRSPENKLAVKHVGHLAGTELGFRDGMLGG